MNDAPPPATPVIPPGPLAAVPEHVVAAFRTAGVPDGDDLDDLCQLWLTGWNTLSAARVRSAA